jgi:hypothetical protein
MAIKVNGTTVIDDSRNVQNVGGFRTVNGTSVVGSGNISAGASTSYGAVGTYVVAGETMTENETIYGGNTRSGSTLKTHLNSPYPEVGGQAMPMYEQYNTNYATSSGLSGTWRMMAPRMQHYKGNYYGGPNMISSLWVRIS